MPELTMGELFAGMCGFSAGFGLSGIRPLWHVEIDRDAQKVIRKHHPDALLLPDVREVNGAALPPVDIITFGSPCQDLSVAGKRAGMAGERSGLFFEATRIIQEMREATDGRFPVAVVWENVPGATSSANGLDFGAALDALAESGAVDLGWRFINSEHWVPQRRSRLFVVACFPPFASGAAGIGRAAEILALTEGVRRDSAKGRKEGEGVAPRARSGIDGSGIPNATTFQNTGQGWWNESDIAATIRMPNGGGSLEANVVAYIPEVAYCLDDATGTRPGSGRDAQDTFVAYAVRTAQTGANGIGVAEEQTHTLDLANAQAVAYPLYQPVDRADKTGADGDPMYTLQREHVHGVAANIGFNWQDSGGPAAIAEGSPTLRNGSQAAVLTGRWQVRRLTPLETVRLQGFPDDYLTGIGLSDAAIYRLTGNAVNCYVTAWLGSRLATALRAEEGGTNDGHHR